MQTRLPPRPLRGTVAPESDTLINQAPPEPSASFWHAWWFWGLAGMALLLGGWFLYHSRTRRPDVLEQTRRRIADDLHDDVGSRISTVALRLELMSRRGSLPETEREQLDELATMARRAVDDLRDTVWVIDAGNDSLDSLIARIEQFSASALEGRSFTVDRPSDVPDVSLSTDERRHLFFFFKEALLNALRHSDADHVVVHLDDRRGQFILEVRDDGIGFNPDAVASGRGLTTLRRRAGALGADFELDSAPGAGTTVRLAAEIT